MNESLQEVPENPASKAPAIIEVKVPGYGEECAQDRTDGEPSGAAPRDRDE